MKTMRMLTIALALQMACSQPAAEKKAASIPWPTAGWVESTPAAEGMSADRLAALDAELANNRHNIDGMLVIRNGRIVYEKHYSRDYRARWEAMAGQEAGIYNYFDPEWHPYYHGTDLHTMQSVTKSVTSALIGIAVGRGEIKGVDVPVLEYLGDYQVTDGNPWKKAMTLRDLLTMRSGIQWDESTVPYTDPANSCAAMEKSSDWVQFVVDQPMAHEPGTVFNYNSGASHLLSLIIKKATGKYADAYAEELLFGPLGIDSHYWKKTPKGFPDTEGGLYLTPRSLAKVGYLYAMDGVWEGARILPEGWVQASVTPISRDIGERKLGYGYQWWLAPWGPARDRYAYACRGYGGQLLFVVPEHDLIAVFTGWNIYPDTPSLDADFVLGSVVDAIGAGQ